MVLAKIVAKNEGRKEREQALHRNVDARKIQAAFRRRLSAPPRAARLQAARRNTSPR